MTVYNGVPIEGEYLCEKCSERFIAPIMIELEEGEVNACPCCKGQFINKYYSVDGEERLFGSLSLAKRAVDRSGVRI